MGCDLASAAGADRAGGPGRWHDKATTGDGGFALLIGLVFALVAATAARRGSLPLAYVALGAVAAMTIGFLDERWIGPRTIVRGPDRELQSELDGEALLVQDRARES